MTLIPNSKTPFVESAINEKSVHGQLADRVLPLEPHGFRNHHIHALYHKKTANPLTHLHELYKLLDENGTFHINVETHLIHDTDGENLPVTITRAADTGMHPMGTANWTRDGALIGANALLTSHAGFPDSAARRKLGHDLLLSNLTLMSTNPQLERFEKIIRSSSREFRSRKKNWPQIFLDINTNLGGEKYEIWQHKQDAWQILAVETLEAIERHDISVQELTAKQKKFFGLIIPFFSKIQPHLQENSGSWEELEAVRTSVMAWDMLLLEKLGALAGKPGYEYLEQEFERHRTFLSRRPNYRSMSAATVAQDLVRLLAEKLAAALPFESPDYHRHDPRYREADASLIYILRKNILPLVAQKTGNDNRWVQGMEQRVLEQILTLQDTETKAIARYRHDSYQGPNFFEPHIQMALNNMYKYEADSEGVIHFQGRAAIVKTKAGREAAWVHPVWQLSVWADEQYLATGNSTYYHLAEQFFKTGLMLVTGEDEVSVERSGNTMRVIDIPSYRITEAFILQEDGANTLHRIPSPHTPLRWGVSESQRAFFRREQSIAAKMGKKSTSALS
ncbi:MAG: hypothetical protein JWM56_328 [Candidatus Peribacteria bacterium]|nr:hypothetical protein [Candidatus Peribacteria bacterium]